jgi:hypothetical protein
MYLLDARLSLLKLLRVIILVRKMRTSGAMLPDLFELL